jgi:predicted nucleic-acid-binding protein
VKRYIIDTNALISFVTDRNLSQQIIVAPLFESAARLKCTLVCHQFVVTEFVFVMDKVYGISKEEINTILRDLINMPGMEIHQQTDFTLLLSLWPSKITDFGDALIAAMGKTMKGATVVTFDAKFKTALKKMGLETI